MSAARPHFPGLEGLRAIAAGLVVLTHAAFLAGDERSGYFASPARYGDIGVAIFFALSGFLIYRPFAFAHRHDRQPGNARGFFWRRALRIFPAYWLALSVLWAIHTWQPFGFVMGFDLGDKWWKYYLLLQIYDPRLGQGGISQSWSIATEISFYLLIPLWSLLVRAVARRRAVRPRIEVVGIVALFIGGYLSRWWFSHSTHLAVQPNALLPDGVSLRAVAFTWLPNQIDLFAIGMAIAVVHVWSDHPTIERITGRITRFAAAWWAAALGFFLIGVYILGAPPAIGYKSAHWQVRQILYGAVGFTLMMPLVFGDLRAGVIRRFMNAKPMWWLGTISYGFYIWHLSIMERLVTIPSFAGPPKWTGVFGWKLQNANLLGLIVVTSILTIIVSALSWYGLEKPLGRFRNVFGRVQHQPDPASPASP